MARQLVLKFDDNDELLEIVARMEDGQQGETTWRKPDVALHGKPITITIGPDNGKVEKREEDRVVDDVPQAVCVFEVYGMLIVYAC